jgi:hypothetical protein
MCFVQIYGKIGLYYEPVVLVKHGAQLDECLNICPHVSKIMPQFWHLAVVKSSSYKMSFIHLSVNTTIDDLIILLKKKAYAKSNQLCLLWQKSGEIKKCQ